MRKSKDEKGVPAAVNAEALLDALDREVALDGVGIWQADVAKRAAFGLMKELDDDAKAEVLLAAAPRIEASRGLSASEEAAWLLLRGTLRCSPAHLDRLCALSEAQSARFSYRSDAIRAGLLRAVQSHAPDLTGTMKSWLRKMIRVWTAEQKPDQARLALARELLGEAVALPLQPGEAWSDAAIAHVQAAKPALQSAWASLISHCMVGSGGAPSGKWTKAADEALKKVGCDEFVRALTAWFPLVDKPRTIEIARRSQWDPVWTNRIIDPHMEALKGLCWVAATFTDADLARALGKLAISAYKKVPGVGPRAVKVGNAAVYALGQMPGMDAVGQLAMLRVKVKFGTAQKGIEKALTAAAEREGLPREEMDELGVPSYGLTEVGQRVETLGDFTVELVVTGIGDTELRFINKDGKPVKSAPAAMKTEFAEELKDLKAAVKDIGAMMPAQRDRLDSLFLDNKTWVYSVWQERYLEHPLVGVLSRRLVWLFRDASDKPWRSGTYLESASAIVGVDGTPLSIDTEHASVRLWHPIEAPGGTDEALAWRRFFEERQIKQPFKQAHREVYLLTDAERNTGTYSNRYAAHVIRQHQFNALCAVRSWKNQLRLMVDAEYPPATRRLPVWGIRAEYWIEGTGEEYGIDTNDAGTYHLLTTDQVRFYRIDAAQASAHAGGGGYGPAWRQIELAPGMPLEEVPALVFSEIMRDVDLFVGVGSVANNPQWQDGGPGGAHREYWWGQSFGDLSETGAGRGELLARLVPRLAIAPVCSIQGKFLVVKGKLRTYKIHLGSGNILMQPNDQYLCIVPSQRAEASRTATGSHVFLPFEGDRTLAVILSKAFMLAADDTIKDPSIVSQIKR